MDSDGSDDDDAYLIRALAGGGAGAREAMAKLYRRHAPALRRWLSRKVASAADADDVVQTTFLNAHAGAAGFRNESKPRTWLWRIARNALVDHYKKKGTSMAEPSGDFIDQIEDLSGQRDELVECVRAGFARFAAKHPERGEALRLAAIEGWSSAELAAHLERSPGATREFISQCRKVLRDFIAHCRTYIMGDGEELRG